VRERTSGVKLQAQGRSRVREALRELGVPYYKYIWYVETLVKLSSLDEIFSIGWFLLTNGTRELGYRRN